MTIQFKKQTIYWHVMPIVVFCLFSADQTALQGQNCVLYVLQQIENDWNKNPN